jgi:hypothetical protein
MNFLTTFIATLAVLVGGSESLVLECEFEDDPYGCLVQNSELITSKDIQTIFEVRGQHESGKNNNDVNFFYSHNKKVKFFPRGLTKFFRNIEKVQIYHGKLQEITKEDLKQFGDKLQELWLGYNKIRVIEGDLFEFNPNLEEIDLSDNYIVHIESGAFNGLEKLLIWLESNPCTTGRDDYTESDRQQVLEIISEVENSCKKETINSEN